MEITGTIVEGRFVSRLNRFEALVAIKNKIEHAHVPNTGRLKELLVEGARIMLKYYCSSNRKTSYSLYLVKRNSLWVSIDSSNIPNSIVAEGLQTGRITNFGDNVGYKREFTIGKSRFDFLLYRPEGDYYLEVKGVTLVEEREARFPDAPTERGTRHLFELTELKEKGYGAGVIFIIQRQDADYIKPNDRTDLKFCEALKSAKEAGVDLIAYRCKVQPHLIELESEIPVIV